MALKWVQDNIESFGGDPNQVTLMGQSAGGVSVALHMMSPMSKGLFQRAIIESAGASPTWGFITNEQSVKRTGEFYKICFIIYRKKKFKCQIKLSFSFCS